jgi:hypothetical protein
MPFTPKRSSINQTLQFGLESTPGTNVAANKLIQCYAITFGSMADVNEFSATGRKYPSIVIENTEWVEGTLTGVLDYNGIVYALSGVCGAATSIVASGVSTTAKLWTFIPPLTGSVQPQTFTIEQGENNSFGNAIYNHKVNYGLISEFGYKIDRKAGATVSGKVLAQALQTAITMTSTPTAVALQPSAGKHFNVYLDPTFGALGTTQLTDALTNDFSFNNIYGMFFPLNRANIGFSAHVDLNPGCTFKLMLPADATGMTQLTNLRAGTTQFMDIKGQGLVIDNNQTLTFGGGVTSGNFTVSYKGQTTANITYAAGLTAATVNTAFQLLSTVGANCTVTGPAGGPYVFTYTGTLALDTTAMTATNVSLAGGTPTIVVTQTQVYAGFEHQMAVKVSNPNPFTDSTGVFSIEYDFTVVEDTGWGNAQKFLITTLLTAL